MKSEWLQDAWSLIISNMNYELSFLTPNLPLNKKDSILKEIENEIKKLEGSLEEKFSEKKKFAYPIKKQKEGFLNIINFSFQPSKICHLRKILEDNKNILRVIIEKRKKIEKVKRYRKKRVKLEKPFEGRKPVIKKKKAKIEELDKKLEEILK